MAIIAKEHIASHPYNVNSTKSSNTQAMTTMDKLFKIMTSLILLPLFFMIGTILGLFTGGISMIKEVFNPSDFLGATKSTSTNDKKHSYDEQER